MSVVDEVRVKITGQVDGDRVNVKRKVIAELEMVCSKYDLKLEENWEE